MSSDAAAADVGVTLRYLHLIPQQLLERMQLFPCSTDSNQGSVTSERRQ
jgi:hypothetical protein